METTKYEAVRGKNLQQSTILGTWSFTERNVLGFTYDMIVTFYEDYHARMTYGTPNTNHGHDVVDIKDMQYSIVPQDPTAHELRLDGFIF